VGASAPVAMPVAAGMGEHTVVGVPVPTQVLPPSYSHAPGI
jgi:hypothetical protein